MNKRKLLRIFTKTKNTIVKYSPEILTAVGIVGLVTAGVKAVADTPKAMDILEKESEKRDKMPLKPVEKVKACWKVYAPSVVLAVGGIFCIVCARRIDATRTAALATAYKLSEEALNEFKERTKEEVGEKKLNKIEDAICEEEIKQNPVKDIWETGDGASLYYDCYSHTYFRSDRTKIERALISFKNQIDNELYVDVNDWERALHLPPIDKDLASLGGWSERDKRGLEVIFSYHEADNGEPCGYVKLSKKPDVNYRNFYA